MQIFCNILQYKCQLSHTTTTTTTTDVQIRGGETILNQLGRNLKSDWLVVFKLQLRDRRGETRPVWREFLHLCNWRKKNKKKSKINNCDLTRQKQMWGFIQKTKSIWLGLADAKLFFWKRKIRSTKRNCQRSELTLLLL